MLLSVDEIKGYLVKPQYLSLSLCDDSYGVLKIRDVFQITVFGGHSGTSKYMYGEAEKFEVGHCIVTS